MTGPLSGIRVVELSTMITAPLAGVMLADMGADVIKVENPEGGDPYRNFRGGQYSPHFCAYNRNKRSVVLDLRSPEGKAALEVLLGGADVLLENFRPGVLARLGFEEARIKAINPRIVHCSVTGFGSGGPYVGRPAYDAVAQALSGLTSLQVDPEAPRIAGPTIADNATGQYAAFGILAALMERERTGRARRVEVNMLECALSFAPDAYGYLTQMGIVSDPYLRARTSQSYVFACSDGAMIAVHLSLHQKFWMAFLEVAGRTDLAEDARFRTRADRIENYEALRTLVAPVFARHPRAYWVERFARHDVPFAPVYTVAEAPEDPQVRHLGSFFEMEHPEQGRLTAIHLPIWLDGERESHPRRPPPTLGEQTEEVLREHGLPPARTGAG
ncbi:CaiB/BaiF CoA transferase family protein [Sabulicella rubraurantiaca]|uniref:CaiB/BaiF CoA transferase family protein n=1 Tax=Sabulicella rubraurantiaca TaxID=2811429 RepID=UPI001A9697AC|nr:CoA transferase [Sabulicella rubraurantiaca]